MIVSGHPVDRCNGTPTPRYFAVIKSRMCVEIVSRMEVKSWLNQRGRFYARRLSLIPALQLAHLW